MLSTRWYLEKFKSLWYVLKLTTYCHAYTWMCDLLLPQLKWQTQEKHFLCMNHNWIAVYGKKSKFWDGNFVCLPVSSSRSIYVVLTWDSADICIVFFLSTVLLDINLGSLAPPRKFYQWSFCVGTVHPQNVRFQNVRLQNVWFQNVRFQNVMFTKRQVYKTSGFKTSGFKTSNF